MSKISSIRVTRNTTNNSLYSVSNITVAITLEDAPFGECPTAFDCYVFADDYYPMTGSSHHAIAEYEWPVLKLHLESNHIWIPGTYTFMIREKEELPQKATLVLDQRMEFHVGPLTDCSFFSQEDVVTESLHELSAPWGEMAHTPGIGALRRKAVESTQMDLYNSLRRGMDSTDISVNRNMLICKTDKSLSSDTLQQFHSIVDSGTEIKVLDCSTLYDATSYNPYEPLNTVLSTEPPVTFCLTNVGALLGTGGKIATKRIVERVREFKENKLWICGTRQEIDSLTDVVPTLKDFFPKENHLQLKPYSAFEMVQALYDAIVGCGLQPMDETCDTLARAVLKGYDRGNLSGWTMADIQRYVTDHVRATYLQRVLDDIDLVTPPQLEPSEIDTQMLIGGRTDFEESIRELNEMIGLSDIKQSITTLANRTRFYQARRQLGLKTMDNTLFHAIFTGNPGTGKTTVARKLGRIYHSLGLLSRGDVIAADRTRLVGRYLGETEENMKTIFEEARGNVLFIDEAYTLSDGASDRKDFGARVIDSLLTVLTQPNPDMLIVFAGYEKEMDAMLRTNTGLMGRFPYKFHFDDYKADELLEIARRLLEREEYLLTDEAAQALEQAINETYANRTKNFGNARWVEQFVRNGIIPAMADRIIATTAPATASLYQTIEAADIRKAFEKYNPKVVELHPRRQIGFSA